MRVVPVLFMTIAAEIYEVPVVSYRDCGNGFFRRETKDGNLCFLPLIS